DSELSLRVVFQQVGGYFAYLKRKWLWILGALILGLLIGYAYSKVGNRVEYIGRIKFLVNGGVKQEAPDPLLGLALASAAPTPSSGADIFESLDITYIMASPQIIERTLLSKISYNNKTDYVINFFINYKKQEKGLRGNSAYSNYQLFSGERDSSDVNQNVYLRSIIEDFTSNLKVERAFNSIISATFKSSDPYFPKYFLEKLIEETSKFYKYTKTARTQQSIRLLEHQADSIRNLMSRSIANSASRADADPNSTRPNTVKVSFQKMQVDNSVLQSTYSTLASSIVTTRIELGKQMPFIQIYERPLFPLSETTGSNLNLNMLKFGFGLMVLALLLLSLRYGITSFKSYLKDN
ncbi:MAG: hypothetical protein WBJ10_07115, partial [Daejeonella sp.]|uniref:hypothetical protein n=1 Tax=Daejeonella sp. TaxID=2805397 RepID=UPI003C72C399